MDKIKILVVDDEARMRKLVKDFLSIKGYQVLEAGDGEEAVDLFFQQKDIALILLDVMMPKMDGWEVVKTIRKYSQVPIIMLTARGEESDELQGFNLGVDEYISKPFSPKILVATCGGDPAPQQRRQPGCDRCGRHPRLIRRHIRSAWMENRWI